MDRKKVSLESRIYGRISAVAPIAVWGVGDFLDYGPSSAVSKALQRLAIAGKLRRIEPGLYDRPRTNPLTNKLAAVDYRALIDAVARRDRVRILIDGMTAANDLGLSDAVPGRVLIHSDARLKPLRLGNLTITFRPTATSKLYWAGRPAMRIVQALHWLKPRLENPAESQRIKRRVAAILSGSKNGVTLSKDLRQGLATLPIWMQDFLRDLISPKGHLQKSSGKNSLSKKRENRAI